jgi:hypothetical protein
MPDAGDSPWYRRVRRWGQTNLNERDPVDYDDAFWRRYWRETRTQGVIVNAGGIVTYYPSRIPLRYRARWLDGRDLYGDIVRSAREEGLAVLARVDSHRVHEPVIEAHPEWFARDVDGAPLQVSDLYVPCVNGGYYREHLPELIAEIVERSAPDGFCDNGWAGPGIRFVCHCAECRTWFGDRHGRDLPKRADWADQDYRLWVEESFARRLELWDAHNAVTTAAGGPDCIWVGMVSGELTVQSAQLHDIAGIARRTPLLLLDHQARSSWPGGFHGNTTAGAALHQLAGWDVPIPESTAHYDGRSPLFRRTAKPAAEVRLWALAGAAGGLRHWWHQTGASTEDRRRYRPTAALNEWDARNEDLFDGRTPLHRAGIGWSQRNQVFFGRDAAGERVVQPYRGAVDAALHHRIPHLPVNLDLLGETGFDGDVLVVPDVAALGDRALTALRALHATGVGLVVTGRTGTHDEWGEPRPEHPLADLLGVRPTGTAEGADTPGTNDWDDYSRHTYLRLHRDRAPREVFDGLDDTDIIAFGGRLEGVAPADGRAAPLTFVPGVRRFPVEMSWPADEDPATAKAALVLSDGDGGRGRVAYLAADLDRIFQREGVPDHGRLLANLVRWAAGRPEPVRLRGPGIVAVDPYWQGDRIVVHLVNHSVPGDHRRAVTEFLPLGPHELDIAVPADGRAWNARARVAGTALECRRTADDQLRVTVPQIVDHEVVVLE